jgi:lysozyme family protein
MTNLDEIFPHLLKHEGGYSDDRNDSGNWTLGRVGKGVFKGTKYGISAAAFPALNIEGLTVDRALSIYRAHYWKAIRADELPPCLRYSVFDMAVNAGPLIAIRCLQRAAGVPADGKLGPKTLAAAATVTPLDYARERMEHYLTITRNDSRKRAYLRNWVNRTFDVLQASLNL